MKNDDKAMDEMITRLMARWFIRSCKLVAVVWLIVFLATFFQTAARSANAAQYFCVGPPVPCTTLTAWTTWSFVPEAAPPHYHHVQVNGHDYGRIARGTAFDYPNSIVVPDTIFVGRFGP
jgi:ABC-type nickel/cobalt efflux system permease component RcnA